MYLARKYIKGRCHYFIRESFRDKNCLRSRDLFALGTDPTRWIQYPGGNAYYIDEAVEDALSEQGLSPSGDELDDIFWLFIDPEIRYKIEPFRRREKRSRAERHPAAEETSGDHHLFDKRRLFCLKTGRTNLSHLQAVPAKIFRILNDKSRDEIEQLFIDMERILRPTEIKTYVYSVFALRDHFRESFAGTIPDFLDQSQVDACFVRELCRLDRDETFWAGAEQENRLHAYLIRYVIMFFDFDYAPRNFMEEYVRNFMNSRRDYHPPPPPPASMPMQEVSDIFSAGPEALKNMSRRELSRLYRRRARDLHPDQGGTSKQFIKLTEAYRSLLRRKK